MTVIPPVRLLPIRAKEPLIKAGSDASSSFSRLSEPLFPHLFSDRLRKIVSKIDRPACRDQRLTTCAATSRSVRSRTIDCLRFRQASFNQRLPKAFTLLEVVLVVVIIGILVALLLPVISSARHKAMTSICTARLRGTGTALILYCNDNGGVLPFHDFWNVYSTFTGGSNNLADNLRPYLTSALITNPANNQVQKHAMELVCPLWLKARAEGGTGKPSCSYYEADTHVNARFRIKGTKLLAIDKPSLMMIMHDSPYLGSSKGVTSHGKKANALFFDGHVELRKYPF